jgi:beta-galactosidase
MTTYFLNLDLEQRKILLDHTRLGGVNRLGERYGVTSFYLTHNGKPFFGISGEFQFARFPSAYWEEELLKMKACGINLVATYVFWIYHEMQPGVFDWSGDKDLRQFVQLCAKHDLPVIARIGPFAHGECRNGGLPDWLYGMPFPVRSNHPEYLSCVRRFYSQVAEQLSGLLFKDGGPVICIQLENEYEHTGAPWDVADRSAPSEWLPRGENGVEHVRQLKQIAEEVGLVTPLYTVTAWGSPVIEDETLPVHGGYAYPVWVDTPEPSDLYMFFDRQLQPYPDIHYRHPYYYPLINAEMQGGIQVRYHNRPVVPARSTEALTLVQMGSGCNFIGYYVFHGGSHPRIHGVFANEVQHPQASYDFQAPIGEFGEVRDAARFARLLHLFVQAFGETLAPMQPVFPQNEIALDGCGLSDTTTLRYSARVKDGAGFLFLNNFQDHLETHLIPEIRFQLQLGGEMIEIPRGEPLTLQSEICCLLPLNLDMLGARLIYATAQPLTIIESPHETHYFYFSPQDVPAEYCFEGITIDRINAAAADCSHAEGRVYLRVAPGWKNSFTFTSISGKPVRVTTLTREEAEHACVGLAWGCQRLILSSADPIFWESEVEFRSSGQATFDAVVFPAVDRPIAADSGTIQLNNPDMLPQATFLKIQVPEKSPQVKTEVCQEINKLQLSFPADLLDGVNDVFLRVDYAGDTAGAYIAGQLVADNYANGTPWIIGLKRFAPAILEHGLVLRFCPLRNGQIKKVSTAMAARIDFDGVEWLKVHAVTAKPEYSVQIRAKGL